MRNMIKADGYRVVQNIAFYVCILLLLFVIGISVYTVSPGSMGIMVEVTASQEAIGDATSGLSYEEVNRLGIKGLRELMLQEDSYKLDLDILAHNINLYYFFIFIVALVIVVDFSTSGVKNTLTSAISRNQYFVAKTLTAALGCLAFSFLNTVLTWLSTVIFDGKNLSAGLGELLKVNLVQIPPLLALVGVLVGIAFVVRRTAVFNSIAIPFVMVFQLLLNYGGVIFGLPEKVADYELSTMMARLANGPSASYVAASYGICAGIVALSLTLGYLSFRRAEIK